MKKLVKEGRVTPKYKGYFVSCWKKENGKNTPYNMEEVESVEVRTVDGNIQLNRDYLLKNKILATETQKGKLGFRIKEGDIVLDQLSHQYNRDTKEFK